LLENFVLLFLTTLLYHATLLLSFNILLELVNTLSYGLVFEARSSDLWLGRMLLLVLQLLSIEVLLQEFTWNVVVFEVLTYFIVFILSTRAVIVALP
jgi:hypothetical protein